MSDLIEAMARGQCASGGYNPDEIMPNGGERWRYYVDLATAALAALRETHHLVPKDSIGNTDVISAPRTDGDDGELVERLREFGPTAATTTDQNLMDQAADRITALSVSNSHWMQEARRLVQGNNEAMETITALGAEVDRLTRAVDIAASTGYRVCAETRHVDLGNKVEAAIRALGAKP
jgi:hypothetical protein